MQKRIEKYLAQIEEQLSAILKEQRPETLSLAIRWAILGGGKRIRPLLCLASAEAAGGGCEDAFPPACAIELLHGYTLVHDDLPAMDNDELRRGKSTVWKKFGEANAILAADALQSLAFLTASRSKRNVGDIIRELGIAGVEVVRGQVEDLVLDRRNANKSDVTYVYERKTAALFMAATAMGAYAADADKAHVDSLREFGMHLGMAFQYKDDLLDDDSPYSREETEKLVIQETKEAINCLENLPGNSLLLRFIAESLVSRDK